MRQEKITADRLNAFSDAVFAVILTIMVLDLRAPDQPLVGNPQAVQKRRSRRWQQKRLM